MIEEWKEVVGFTDYECSNLGNYRHKTRKRILRGTAVHNGYKHIGLKLNGKQVWHLHHRLIAKTWLIPADASHNVVNHKNHNRTDNRVENLEWTTPSLNAKHKRAKTEKCICCGQPIYNKT